MEGQSQKANPVGSTHAFAVRQPIFDQQQETVAYQIVAREGMPELLPQVDVDQVTKPDWDEAWLTSRLSTLARARRTCLTFSPEHLARGYPLLFPPGSIVIKLPAELIADPDDQVIEACASFRKSGHLVALELAAPPPGVERLMSVADIVKVSLRSGDVAETCRQVRQLGGDRIRLLGGQVDTHHDYSRALELGMPLLQGTFFLKPQLSGERDIAGNRLSYFKLLEAANRPEPSLEEIETIVSSDLTLVHRLLKFLGSAAFGFRAEIRSVRHGLALLGERRIRSFVSLVALVGLCDDRPTELLVTAAVRGKFCELVGDGVLLGDRKAELFLIGALSLLDTMLGVSTADAIDGLSLHDDIRRALLGEEGQLGAVLDFVRHYEQAEWQACEALARDHGVDTHQTFALYSDAVAWATEACGAL